MTNPTPTPLAIDRADTETALYRVAISAFTYYPGKEWEEPGYAVAEDIAWCLAPLAGLPTTVRAEFAEAVRTLITNPTADRRAFIRSLAALTGETAEAAP